MFDVMADWLRAAAESIRSRQSPEAMRPSLIRRSHLTGSVHAQSTASDILISIQRERGVEKAVPPT